MGVREVTEYTGSNKNVIVFDGFAEYEEVKIRVPVKYKPLFEALFTAFKQAAYGKGKERHANGEDFLEQPIFEIPKMLPNCGAGFLAGQGIKKTAESVLLYVEHGAERACAEIDGAICYLAALKIFFTEEEKNKKGF